MPKKQQKQWHSILTTVFDQQQKYDAKWEWVLKSDIKQAPGQNDLSISKLQCYLYYFQYWKKLRK